MLKQIVVETNKQNIKDDLQTCLDHFNKQEFDCERVEYFYEVNNRVFFLVTFQGKEIILVNNNRDELEKMFQCSENYVRCEGCLYYDELHHSCRINTALKSSELPCDQYQFKKSRLK